jgi:tetratricopeptide (TPR) repeat protein
VNIMRAGVSFLALAASVSLAVSSRAQDLRAEQVRDEARQHYETGNKLMSEEAFEKAVAEFRQATELDPNFTLAYYGLGQALMPLKRYPEAVDAYTAAKDTLNRISAMDQKARGEWDRRRRDEIKSLQDELAFAQSSKMKGERSELSGQIMALEQRLRVLQQSDLRDATQAIKVPAELSLALGSANFRMGKLPEAEKEYREAVSSDSKLGAAHNNLAVIYMLSGRFDEAKLEVKAAEKAGFRVSDQFKKDLKQREDEAKKASK